MREEAITVNSLSGIDGGFVIEGKAHGPAFRWRNVRDPGRQVD
jgi:hypothetical protein